MKVDPSELLPFEVWRLILLNCSFTDRLACRATCRAFATLAHVEHSDWLVIPPTAVSQHIQCAAGRYQNARITCSGSLDQWCSFVQSTTVRRLHWAIGYSMPRVDPMQLTSCATTVFSVLPTNLRELVLDSVGQMSELVLRSLGRSLALVRPLDTVVLRGINWVDALHMVNFLSRRADDPYNTWLERIEIVATVPTTSSTPGAMRPLPELVDTGGLAAVRDFHLEMITNTGAAAAADVLACANMRDLADAFICTSRTPLDSFVYKGWPLQQPRMWAHVIHRSVQTLHSLVMPGFEGDLLEPESAVDATQRLVRLTVDAVGARLDFMLRNKSALKTLIHHGSVYSAEQLIDQLTETRGLIECFIGAAVGSEFAWRMATTVRWPVCERLALGGVDAATTEMVRLQVVS